MKESAMGGMSKAAGALQGLDPRLIEQLSSRIKFPASKESLISQAKESGASQGVIDMLNQFEDKQYNSSDDIKSEIQRIQGK
ncbi:DUF2795 domain-containing protein [Methanoculleus thermophilus]|nr:DUF2795 domain-containing protein [Methanoculleus thermophilus]HQD26194.1 DUF2795 domain-containing protein [Methanoculleus thermophilus]